MTPAMLTVAELTAARLIGKIEGRVSAGQMAKDKYVPILTSLTTTFPIEQTPKGVMVMAKSVNVHGNTIGNHSHATHVAIDIGEGWVPHEIPRVFISDHGILNSEFPLLSKFEPQHDPIP